MTRTMRDSGVEWIGEVPEQWILAKLKYNCSGFQNGSSQTQLNSDISNYPVTRIETISTGKIDFDKVGYVENINNNYLLKKNDFLISNINSIANLGNNAIFDSDRPLYHGMNLLKITPKFVYPKFLYYYFNSGIFRTNMQILCKPAINQASVSASNIKNIKMPFPPLPEQQVIADYLDDKCAQIDNITDTINEQIEVLKQYKKSVITEAVTKGLDPNVPMKDSGVEWIGQIPKQWNVKPIYTTFSEVIDKNYTGDVKTALRFSFGTIIPKENFNSDEDDYVANTIKNYTVVEPGNIVINGLNLNYDFVTKRVAIVNDFGAITSAYISIKPDANKAYPKFMLYLLKSYDHCRAFHGMGEGVRKILNYSELKKNKVILPPLPEQQAIADYLDDKCAKIDAVIADKQTQLETLAAYKKSLIYEYVTGKKSVPGFEEA